MNLLIKVCCIVSSLLIVSKVSTSQAQAPDMIFTNGKVFTSGKAALYAEALAVKGDRIVAVGTTAGIEKLAGKKTKRINLAGRTVVPGFNDAHDHIGYGVPLSRFIAFNEPMLSGPGLQQVLDSLQVAVKSVPLGTMIQGHIGLRMIEDSSARRAALDKIAPDHPVLLNAPWGHGTILNTKAMELLGILLTAPDPVGGRYERISGSDELSGLLIEYAEFEVMRNWHGTLPQEAIVQAFKRYGTEAIKLGITSVQNMATSLTLTNTLAVLKEAALPQRVRVIRFPGTTERGRVIQPWSATYQPGPMIQVSGMKWILDGTPLERGAFMQSNYSDKPTAGRLNFPVDTIRKMLKEAIASKEQLLLHIVGDSTPNLVINEMLKIGQPSVWKGKRLRFEHADGLYPARYGQAKQLGIIPVVNPSHFMFAEVNIARVGNERAGVYQPFRSLLEAGIPVAIGSDGPINPFLNIMFAAMHPTNPKEAVTVEQAVIAYTWGSAHAEFMEREKGMLKKGMLADFAVLSQDIFTIPLPELPKTSSLMTVVGGKVVWDAGVMKQ